jgi:flagellar motor switch protein FliN/FliY
MADEPQQAGASDATVSDTAAEATVDRTSIESLLNEAQSALSSLDEPAAPLPPGVKPFEFKDLFGGQPANEQASLDLLNDVQLDLKIELGRTQMQLEDVLRLKQGAVVTLDKLAGDPVDIYANGRLIARGEVLVLNDNFCVRVAELIAGDGPA